MSKVITVNDDNFREQVLDSREPVLVDFWASWCPPCKMMEPLLDELAEEYDTEIKFVKLNVDQNPNAASQFSVKGVPAFMVFIDSNMVEESVGAQSREQLEEMIDRAKR